MPTENRSTNTKQMVSVPASKLKKIHRDLDACQKVIWLRGGFDPAYCMDAQDSLKDIDALLAQPAAQHQDEPILIQAVAVTREDDDEGLRLEWLLEGGISEMEFAGQVLFAMPDANGLCDEDGSAEIYLHPPTSDGYSAGDMADQGAKALRNGQRAMVLPDREMYTQYPPGVTPSNATEVNSYRDGWNACLDEARRLNEASISSE